MRDKMFFVRVLILLPLALIGPATAQTGHNVAYDSGSEASSVPAPILTVLHSFAGSPDGASPGGSLAGNVQVNAYGTTWKGGAYDAGTVFKISKSGKETVLHSFGGTGDGSNPNNNLAIDAQGNLLGTTVYGGAFGQGMLFKVDKVGNETVLYNFGATAGDGAFPEAGVVLDKQGNIYGTTVWGGSGCGTCGTVFKLDMAGNETILYDFQGTGGDGMEPNSSMVLDSTGNLYGTTAIGGTNGVGTVFKLDAASKETVLYSFTGAGDGSYPSGGLVMDGRRNLYGTTDNGAGSNSGTVFKLDGKSKETVLHTFTGTGGDGAAPQGGVLRDANGNLYGTTEEGGTGCTCGTVFKLDSAGNETVLYNFTGTGGDGARPDGRLIRDTLGNLYGTTREGGFTGNGSVFKLTP
jgi:uncharacterized repeat protein (TIGR03803 family)